MVILIRKVKIRTTGIFIRQIQHHREKEGEILSKIGLYTKEFGPVVVTEQGQKKCPKLPAYVFYIIIIKRPQDLPKRPQKPAKSLPDLAQTFSKLWEQLKPIYRYNLKPVQSLDLCQI